MFRNVIIGWLARRGLELGGIAAAIFTWYMAQPPNAQDAISRVFTGGWREVPIGIYLGIGAALWGYVWSYLSTVRPQVVTASKQQIRLTPDSNAQAKVEVLAKSADRPRTLWERLTKQ